MQINNCLSRLVITAATLVTGAAGCLQAGDELGSETSPVVVITKSDLDAIPQGEELKLSADGGYRFDTGRGPLSLNRIVGGETPLADSFRDGGVSDAQLDWIESAGFTLTPMAAADVSNKPGDAEHSSLAASCTDRAYNILYYVAPSGSVSEYKVWFCRA